MKHISLVHFLGVCTPIPRNRAAFAYISTMNRRRFTQSLAAVLSLPAMPSLALRSTATAAVPAAAAVPTQARFWAIYISALHGDCPPQTLQTLLNVPAQEAKSYLSQLIAEGVIKPNPLLKNTVRELVKTDQDSVIDRFKKRLEMKAQKEPAATKETLEQANPFEPEEMSEFELLDAEVENSEIESESEITTNDEPEPNVSKATAETDEETRILDDASIDKRTDPDILIDLKPTA